MRDLSRSRQLYEEASSLLAGGVSSDIRRVPGGVPLYIDRASGPRMWDVDGNEYLDYVLGQGPQFFGHSHPRIVEAVQSQMAKGQVYSAQHELEIEVAALVCELVPCAELVRFNSTGSEAVHAALRLARGVTGRPKVLKFEGHYHGWLDPVLVSVHPDPTVAGPADRPIPVLSTGGQTANVVDNLVIAPWNDPVAFEGILDEHQGEIAAVIMEPLLCNTGCIAPDPEFLRVVRERTATDDIVLIFDEIITGFRLAPGGAQQYLGVTPDLAVFGKAMAGGLPLACLAGKRVLMDAITTGQVQHAGTFNSNPVVMSGAAAALGMIKEGGETLYEGVRARGRRLMAGIAESAAEHGLPLAVHGPGPVFNMYGADPGTAITNYREYAETDVKLVRRVHEALLERGVNTVGRGLWFLSTEHSDGDIDETIAAVDASMEAVAR